MYQGNNAYRLKIEEREKLKLKRRDNPKYEYYIKRERKKIIAMIVMVTAVAFLVMLRYAEINILNNQIQSKQKNYEQLVAQNTNLEMERDRVIDLSTVEDIAVNQYGMATPTRDQVIYITVTRPDEVRIAQKNGLIAFLKNTIGQITSKS
ncbi:MAG: cell division protein FtsL [Bacillota bacterium]|nr:cell division protein FtsL [Bacillota bacterium]